MAKVVQAFSEDPALTNRNLDTGVLQKREKFVNVFYVVFNIAREDQHVVTIYQGSLASVTKKYDIQTPLEGCQGGY